MSASRFEYLRHILDEFDFVICQWPRITKRQFPRDDTLRRAFVRSREIVARLRKKHLRPSTAKSPSPAESHPPGGGQAYAFLRGEELATVLEQGKKNTSSPCAVTPSLPRIFSRYRYSWCRVYRAGRRWILIATAGFRRTPSAYHKCKPDHHCHDYQHSFHTMSPSVILEDLWCLRIHGNYSTSRECFLT